MRILRVQLDHVLHEVLQSADQVVRLLSDLTQDRLDRVGHLLVMLHEEHGENRFLVGEILVEGTDRDPGPLRDVVGGGAGVAPLFENASRRLHDLPHGEARPALRRLFSSAYGFPRGHDSCF